MDEQKQIDRRQSLLSKEETRDIVKEGIKEFLAEQMTTFGVFSAKFIFASIISALLYLFFLSHGFKAP